MDELGPSAAHRVRAEAVFALAVSACFSFPAIKYLIKASFTAVPKKKGGIYEDEDGKSTREDVAKFSVKTPKAFIALFCTLGCASSASISLLNTAPRGQRDGLLLVNWLHTAVWMVLAFNSICVVIHRDSRQAYNLGIWLCLSVIVLGLVMMDLEYVRIANMLRTDNAAIALRALSFIAAIGLALSAVSIPRRPAVYMGDRPVDAGLTTSALDRFVFSWCKPLLRLANAKKDLDFDDFPALDHHTRSADRSVVWDASPAQSGGLWRAFMGAYKGLFALQWTLAILQGVTNFVPHWFTLKLLEVVEIEINQDHWSITVWFLVLGLVVSIFIDGAIESWLYWIGIGRLALPIRVQLSTLIFEKSMRRKNVKAAAIKKDEQGDRGQNDMASETSPLLPAKQKAANSNVTENTDEGEPDVLASRQGIINLIGLDAKRLSDFLDDQVFFIHSAALIVASVSLLTYLLGWIPVVAGSVAGGLIMPVSTRFATKYATAQDRVMKARDEKLQVVNECLQGARQIKFSALGKDWEDRILGTRAKVLARIWDAFVADTVLFGCWILTPIVSAAAALSAYAFLNGGLNPSVAFVGVAVFRSLESTLSIVPELISEGIDAWVSMRRIERYLGGPEIEPITTDGPCVAFENAPIAWPVDEETPDEDRFLLRDVNLTFPNGELSVISGKTGTGKSLILSAIIGEADLLAGKIIAPASPSLGDRHDHKAHRENWIIPNSKAYVAQVPWIENGTLKDNVLFGLLCDEQRYNAVLEACALTKDLQALTDGDKTELGTNGINLSGGQKWRVTLARAVYSRAGILILDDIFSAVDAHVGRHIYEQCLTGDLCRGRTRILVTHHVGLCQPRTKFLVELGEGTVQHAGFVEELEEDGTLELIKRHEQPETKADVNVQLSDDTATEAEAVGEGAALSKAPSRTPRQFVEDEVREKGAVKLSIYKTYLRASGGLMGWTLAACLFLAYQALIIGRSYWLKIWTGSQETQSSTYLQQTSRIGVQNTLASAFVEPTAPDTAPHNFRFYLVVYIAISLAAGLIGTLRVFYTYTISIRASRILFEDMTFAVLRAPLRWLDTVPLGRVLNRFTGDFNTVDSDLARNTMLLVHSSLNMVGICVAANLGTIYLFPPAVMLVACSVYISVRYLTAARPARRLQSNSKSPMFELYGSVLTGVTTIRAFGNGGAYLTKMYGRLDGYSTASYYLAVFNRWVGWWMMVMGSAFTGCAAALILATKGMDAALAGFTITFALDFKSAMFWAVRCYANVELDMNSAERVVEYTSLETEDQGGEHPPAAWPTEGKVEVEDLVVGYADDLPPVLKGLSFRVRGRERVGVVGRTGAGKSSLTLALFRFLDARAGSIYIDGLDISKINLYDLRSRLAIIPQDPVLFTGTVRSNLDPFDNHSDAELRDSLERVHLISTTQQSSPGRSTPPASSSSSNTNRTPSNANIFEDLSSPISEGGGNLSQGQRQLLCLARAIVSRPRVMVLDEATSAVDMHTDSLIQESIRSEFRGCTLIVIAHRLSTIADFDRVLVLEAGEVAEFGTPEELWEREDGVFRGMCEQSGESGLLEGIILGKKDRVEG